MAFNGKQGFGNMDPEKQRELARRGGKAAHAKGTAHEWNSEEARRAGRIGGIVSRGGRGRVLDQQQEEAIVDPQAERPDAEGNRMAERGRQ